MGNRQPRRKAYARPARKTGGEAIRYSVKLCQKVKMNI
jgi:hypothetical protein